MSFNDREAFSREVLGEEVLRAKGYDEFLKALELHAKQEVFLKVLRDVDAFCAKENIGYFMFAETLQGMVAYEDFAPNNAVVHLGMLQEDYDLFVKRYFEEHSHNPSAFSWRLGIYLDEYPSVLRRAPRLYSCSPVSVKHEGEQVFTRDSLPLVIDPHIEISIFNATPDDFYVQKRFYRQMLRRNRLLDVRLNMKRFFSGGQALRGVPPLLGLFSLLIPVRLLGASLQRRARAYEGKGMQNVVRVKGKRSKFIAREDLMPYQRLKLRDIELNCPAILDTWAPACFDNLSEELKRLQDAALQIVTEIDRVCRKLGIGYFVCGGTLLGYKRHGGFIPWDDDIDVGMFREDYERFAKEAPAVLDKETFFLQTRESDPNIPYLFSKIRLNDSSYVTAYNQFRDFHKGICVDIFPFDAVPSCGKELETFRDQVYKQVKEHNHIANRQYPQIEIQRSVQKNIDWLLAQVIGRLLTRYYWGKSLVKTQEAFDRVVQTYNSRAVEEELPYVACFIPSYTMVRREDLLPYDRVKFEGLDINVPSNPNIFLAMQYGDYMALPPLHKRQGHDLLEWDIGNEKDFDNNDDSSKNDNSDNSDQVLNLGEING